MPYVAMVLFERVLRLVMTGTQMPVMVAMVCAKRSVVETVESMMGKSAMTVTPTSAMAVMLNVV